MDMSRPTDAEEQIESKPELAYASVINHLRTFGPNAKVAILAPTEAHLEYILTGPNGLLSNCPEEFSRRTKLQFNHRGGGEVRCYTSDRNHASQYIMGAIFSQIWADKLDVSDKNALELLKQAQYCLKYGPNPKTIFANDGEITRIE
jgi:hypothetical protein